MFPLKRLAGFFARVALFFVLLMIPWPGIERAYGAFFRVGGNLVLGSFGARGETEFLPLREGVPAYHTEVKLINRAAGLGRISTYPNRYLGYVPLAAVVALVLATPIPWRRRWWALLWGLALVNGFVVVRVALPLLKEFSDGSALSLFSLSPFWKKALDVTILALVTSPPSVFVVPLLIWILVTFRRGDFRAEGQSGRQRP